MLTTLLSQRRTTATKTVPIANAILTTENLEQAIARQTEKGADAARVAVEMAMLISDLVIPDEELMKILGDTDE